MKKPALLALSLLLAACGQQATSPTDPYAAEYAAHPSQPWTSSALSALSLTPGTNTLGYEKPTYASSGWGPIEVNRSNGGRQQLDGNPLTIGGQVYAKGYGVHSTSELRYSLASAGATCTSFTATVGIDDEVGTKGSVVFEVWADGKKLTDSGVVRGSDGPKTLTADLTGKSSLSLRVTDAGDGNFYDHADWVNPTISCQATTQPHLTLDRASLELYHLHGTALKAHLTGFPAGPVNLRLVYHASPTYPNFTVSPLDLQTPLVAGNGDAQLQLFASRLTADDPYPNELLLEQDYTVVASQNGRDLASAPLHVTEKPLKLTATLLGVPEVVPNGTWVDAVLSMTVDPPVQAPIADLGLADDDLHNTVAQNLGEAYGDGHVTKRHVRFYAQAPGPEMPVAQAAFRIQGFLPGGTDIYYRFGTYFSRIGVSINVTF
ncbi:NPCBM/NEW2 domain-containing protein [Deinococcus sonorensis]|uniref:NPCBM/NEW2 domain-containing protein n=1 Tax=Deinococcus sonorensis KR-87 TaxID=694439 RepID=A0AAU7U5D6_9DEIO